MDQEGARTLAREAGTRAAALGIELDNSDDPDCAELTAACRRVGVQLAAIFRC